MNNGVLVDIINFMERILEHHEDLIDTLNDERSGVDGYERIDLYQVKNLKSELENFKNELENK